MIPAWLAPWEAFSGSGYQFYSGIGSDLGEVTLIFAVAGWWHHVNCIEKGCWRKGHKDPEHGHPVCRKHAKGL